ncbi:MAG: hypothetical protein HY694_04130 [Deltaproteobacteria bacterium]|nr:hypothetical protein [Deltaproteobacteria bacterium]
MLTGKTLMLISAVAALFAVASLGYAEPRWSDVTASWPETAKNTAKEIAQKYGAPDMVGSDLLVWKNKGPYVWIQVNRMEVQHNFPGPHKDVLDIAIPYKVPVAMLTKLAEFDGSAVAMRTKGLLVASCFKEGLDILILNLANDVVTGKKTPEEARAAFGEIATGMVNGKKNPYTEALQFKVQPLSATQDPDKPLQMKKQ